MVVSWDMFALLHSFIHKHLHALSCSCFAVTWNPLYSPSRWVVPGQDNRRLMGWLPRIGKGGGDWGIRHRVQSFGQLGLERRGFLNQVLIKIHPLGLIKRHSSDQLPFFF